MHVLRVVLWVFKSTISENDNRESTVDGRRKFVQDDRRSSIQILGVVEAPPGCSSDLLSEPKNHHLLPRFYLSGFCDSQSRSRESYKRQGGRPQCRVWVHDRQQGCIEERSVKTLTVRRHYYSSDTPGGGRDARPEKALAELEDRVAPILKRLVRLV